MSAHLDLDLPRFCSAEELAELFGFSRYWIYKLNNRGKGPPHLPDLKPYRYDTRSRAFRDWLVKMGVDVEGENDCSNS
jgi:predicted DNA-binding transcriptional regulator AlpA